MYTICTHRARRCKRLGVTVKEDLSLGPSSVADLMNQKFPLCYHGPLYFFYATYVYCMRLQIFVLLHLYWEAATESFPFVYPQHLTP